ncbi:MAG: Crp/Fnr family transcriptional regulator [Caldilineae bacterium]|nr:Crp/Fnr family transcriptional regulator [Chloroflexota bacterium]MCB9176675.1 Crp/Fnr family transcriptional regulator [Caldilineae bacterium]
MTARIEISTLRDMELFRGLDAEALERVAGLLHQSRFSAGHYIMSAEQPGEVVYVIREGTVKVLLVQDDGSEVILSFLGAGDTVGEMSLLDSSGRSASVLTLEPTSALWMDRQAFFDCMRELPALNFSLLRLLARRLRLANARIRVAASLDVAGRVAYQLLTFADQYGVAVPQGTRIPLRITQSDLGDLVGASRESVNKALKPLKGGDGRSGAISVDARYRITVHDRQALERRALL